MRTRCTAVELHILKKSTFRERHAGPVADDEVIKHADVDEREGILQTPRDELIRRARLCHTGGVVVRKDNRCGIVRQSLLHDFARMNARAIDGPTEHFLE